MGDFGANFQRPDTGIFTAEGNVAGARAAMLSKKREQEQLDMEAKKAKIKSDSVRQRQGMDTKFQNHAVVSTSEQTFRSKTIGLVTAEEFRRAAEAAAESGGNGIAGIQSSLKDGLLLLKEKQQLELDQKKKEHNKESRKEKKKRKKEKKRKMAVLSFAEEEEDSEVEPGKVLNSCSSMKKNPFVDTSFLPDKEREETYERERNRLMTEWIEKQEDIKKEQLEVVYSYWDGSGHRRTTIVKKGATIAQFLDQVRQDLAKDFRELVNASDDDLLYVKEDLIIPHDITFYDLIATKARGKSGPLFNFDVHDDVRIGPLDSRVEKDESHPGKVVERRWYDRNKHIFPASRWESYDPSKEYGRYTIHGGEVK